MASKARYSSGRSITDIRSPTQGSALNTSSRESYPTVPWSDESDGKIGTKNTNGCCDSIGSSSHRLANSPPPCNSNITLDESQSETVRSTENPENPENPLEHCEGESPIPEPTSIKPNYRILPLLIGCIIPISILLNVPSVASPWVGLPQFNETSQGWSDPMPVPIPRWLNAIIIVGLVTAVTCNICILLRFLERHVYYYTIVGLVAATLQDLLSLAAVISFCFLYPSSEQYEYLEGFWAMIASMVFSFAATLLITVDLYCTPNFRYLGSGVTHKQRILILEALGLCFFLTIGAVVFIYTEDWNFLVSLYFAMVTITTVGFGVPAPVTLGGRTFVVFFGACGIVLLAMVITSIRYVILEDLHRRFTARAHERKARKEEWRRKQHMHRQIPFQRQQQRLREALNRIRHSHDSARIDSSSVENAVNLSPCFPQRLDPLLIQPKDKVRLSPSDKNGRDFNGEDIEGDGSIPPAGQLKISDNRLENSECTWSDMPNSNEVQPNGHIIFADCVGEHTLENRPSNAIQLNQETHPSPAVRGLSALLKRIAMAFKRISTKASAETRTLNSVDQQEEDRRQAYDESMEEYRRRLYFSTTMFFIFWLAGALIFMFIESWDFGTSCYFIFVVFSTIGYGDVTPQTNAGRAVFLAYCLLGVATLTSLASLMSEVLGKTMRKHLVDSQLRREENLRQLEGISGQDTTLSIDLEAGQGDDEGDFISTAHLLSEDNAVIEENENQGTLHKLISASKELDEALQSLIGPDYSDPKPKGPKTLDQDERLDKNSGHIVQFLEEEDNECDLVYQDMGKDMESIMAPLQRPKMPKQSQSHSSNRDTRDLKREHEASLQDSREDPSQGNSTRPLSMGSNAASNLDWQQLVQCAKQIKALAQECEHSVHQIHEWAELEKRAHQRQVLIRERQKQVLEVRRARRERLGVQRGDIEDDIQDEEELEYWGEEEDHGENKIGTLDKQRASITVMLLGRSYGNSTIAPATDPTTTAAPKRSTTEPPQGAPRIPEPISNLQYRRRTFRTLGSREGQI